MPPKDTGTLLKGPIKHRNRLPAKPLTTRGKIERAKRLKEDQLKNKPREAPASSRTNFPDGTSSEANTQDSTPTVSKPKARSFAPPAELDQRSTELALRDLAKQKKATIKNGKRDFSNGKAMTTRQKAAVARATKRTTGGAETFNPDLLGEKVGRNAAEVSFSDQPEVFSRVKRRERDTPVGRFEAVASGVVGKTSAKAGTMKEEWKRRALKAKPLGLMKLLGQVHQANAIPMVRPPPREDSVLMRPTRRTARIQLNREQEEQKRNAKSGIFPPAPRSKANERTEPSDINLIDLNDEIRARVWRFVVVETRFPIWPAEVEGREQPDLAMTCRQIRAEVLAIYYSENVFAINLRPQTLFKPLPGKVNALPGCGKKGKDLTGLAAIGKWGRTLQDPQNETGKWFGMIKSLAFDYQDAVVGGKDKSFLVSLKFGGTADYDEMDSPSCMLSWSDSPMAEVHQEAACIMKGWSDCGRCVIKTSPGMLQAAIIKMLEHGGLTASNLIGLAQDMRGMVERLSSSRCEKRRR